MDDRGAPARRVRLPALSLVLAALLLLLLPHGVTGRTRAPVYPTGQPSTEPSQIPTGQPTREPTNTFRPTFIPTAQPSSGPSQHPTSKPSVQPSCQPTMQPSRQPTTQPSRPTRAPTKAPTKIPTRKPTPLPTTHKPTVAPSTFFPTRKPTVSLSPTQEPVVEYTQAPTITSTPKPTALPTTKPIRPTMQPTSWPTARPTSSKPTRAPSRRPTVVSRSPTGQPTTEPSTTPSRQPSGRPSLRPSSRPTATPTKKGTPAPTAYMPTSQPTRQPSRQPSSRPSKRPSSRPTQEPTLTHQPTTEPTTQPTRQPSRQPSRQPTSRPTIKATAKPSTPTGQPTRRPSREPSGQPTHQPTREPSGQPSMQPTQQPTQKPSRPTGQPSNRPTMQPSCQPTYRPVISYPPSGQPSTEPSHFPSGQPTSEPTRHPTKVQPSSRPTRGPSSQPSTRPTQETITRQPTSYLSTDHAIGTVTLVPANADYCTPVEIQISLTVKKSIKAGEYVVIGTPGITSGPCLAATKGGNINSMVMTATNSSGYPISSLEPWQQFTGRYIEGDYVNNYQASRMRFILTAPMHGGTHYLIRIDRSNALRRTCVHNQTWAVTFGHNLVAGLGASLPTTYIPGGNLTFRDNHPKNCFQYFSNLQFYPPYPQQRMSLNFTFLLPFTLRRGDRVVLHLPGFTNKVNNYPLNMMRPNSTVNPLFLGVGKSRTGLNVTTSTSVYDYSVGPVPLVLTYNTKYLWRGTWHEGTNTSGLLAFNHSYLTLYPLGDETSSQTVWVSMSAYENNLISLFGRVANYPGFTVEIFSKMFKLNQTAVTQTTAIGPGCNDYNGCSGNGRCNYELATCSCFDGFGSAADVARTDVNTFLPDCSALACPAAMASVTMAQVSRQTSGFDYHRIVECSNNGMCDRKTGKCKCFPGYQGGACERRACPGTPACNGRGVCYSMAQLPAVATAMPLVPDNVGDEYVDLANATATWRGWDAGHNHACVCDSGWPVGLGSGQTQLAEFFGPSCELRRCPSGDDPHTTTVVETDCSGIAQVPGGSVGQAGNLCHVDCSNQGVCDYATGTCTCFQGYWGDNCGMRTRYAVNLQTSGAATVISSIPPN